MSRRVEIEIGTIVVETGRLDPHRFERALRLELTRHLSAAGSRTPAVSRAIRVARAHPAPTGADASARIGRAVASAVARAVLR